MKLEREPSPIKRMAQIIVLELVNEFLPKGIAFSIMDANRIVRGALDKMIEEVHSTCAFSKAELINFKGDKKDYIAILQSRLALELGEYLVDSKNYTAKEHQLLDLNSSLLTYKIYIVKSADLVEAEP